MLKTNTFRDQTPQTLTYEQPNGMMKQIKRLKIRRKENVELADTSIVESKVGFNFETTFMNEDKT